MLVEVRIGERPFRVRVRARVRARARDRKRTGLVISLSGNPDAGFLGKY